MLDVLFFCNWSYSWVSRRKAACHIRLWNLVTGQNLDKFLNIKNIELGTMKTREWSFQCHLRLTSCDATKSVYAAGSERSFLCPYSPSYNPIFKNVDLTTLSFFVTGCRYFVLFLCENVNFLSSQLVYDSSVISGCWIGRICRFVPFRRKVRRWHPNDSVNLSINMKNFLPWKFWQIFVLVLADIYLNLADIYLNFGRYLS